MTKNLLIAVTAAGIALAPLAALAQSAPSAINQTGPSVTFPGSSPTDMGIEGVSGNTNARAGGIYMGGPRAAVPAAGYQGYAAAPGYDANAYGSYGAADADAE